MRAKIPILLFPIVTVSLLAAFADHRQPSRTPKAAPVNLKKSMITVEIRSYNLKPGTRDEFHRLASEVAVPMLRRWKIDVIAYGASRHDDNSYYLMRGFSSLAGRQRAEDAFYGSEEWRKGPREAVLALIESYATVVVELDEATVAGLRASNSLPGNLPRQAGVELKSASPGRRGP
jgi:hypothetical protein